MTSILSAFPFIGEQSFATPGAFNSPLSTISANIAAINADVGAISGVTISPPSGNTIQIPSDLSVSGYLSVGKGVSIGTQAPGTPEPVALTIGVNSGISDYIYFNDTANLRSDYLLGSHVGGTADGLNIFDVSGNTMIVSFSKQSIRFYQNVVGPVFDVGGALASTLNAATFGTGADSTDVRVQAAINAASLANLSRVYIPANMTPYSASSVSFINTVKMVTEGQNWGNYNVLAYGAAGDNTRDDFYAVQAAITAAFNAPGGVAEIPPRVYSCSSTLVVPPQGGAVRISGNGRARGFTGTVDGDVAARQGATIVYTATTGDIIFSSLTLTNKRQYITLENLSFEGRSIASGGISGHGIHFQVALGTSGILVSLHDISVNNTPQNGIFWDGNIFECQCYNVRSSQNSGRGFQAAANGAGLPGETRLYACTFDHNSGPGVDIAGGGHWSFHGLTCTANESVGLIATSVEVDGYDFQLESNGTVFGRFVNCNGIFLSGININYGSNSSATALWFGGASGCHHGVITGLSTNGLATNTDVVYADGNQQQNAILGYPGNAALGTLSVSDNGFFNTIWNGSYVSGVLQGNTGSATAPIYAFRDDPGVGWYRSTASTVALSAGTLFLPSVLSLLGGGAVAIRIGNNSAIRTGAAGGALNIDVGTMNVRDGDGNNTNGIVQVGNQSAAAPAFAFSQETALGLYKSGASTIAQSYGTFNLATNAVRLSMRTIAASALTASAANTNVAVNEAVFTIQASGASFVINSGGTTWIFNSSASAKNT